MSKTVLIVDDSLSIRQLVKAALTSVGYGVIDACDGQDALNKLVGQRVNLIISDVNMPNISEIPSFLETQIIPSVRVYKRCCFR